MEKFRNTDVFLSARYIYLEGFRPLFRATQYILKSFLEINTNYLWICISINPDAYSQNPIFRSEKKHDKLRFLLCKTQQLRIWRKLIVRVSTTANCLVVLHKQKTSCNKFLRRTDNQCSWTCGGNIYLYKNYNSI